ncbi:glucosaminidase domain-containing protein [Legionella fairfieldensis]|uniref:glucosaminidase domain-containing protein n=1 Tax=Legionella fairfieldensis TaxID=45064 RepID=UPI0004912D64|nr:glucosaminidase domain-containing protein [Legionella fairfieldensis]
MAIEGIAVSDFQGLQQLKAQAKSDPNKALPEVSKQFEAIFLQSMLKSMRMGQHFIDESNPLRGEKEAMFQDMLDGQYANTIANGQGIGLAAMLAKQLEKSDGSVARTQNVIDPSLLSSRMTSQLPSSLPKDNYTPANIDDFVKSAWPYAQQAANLLGLDPKLLMAQAALETGWGQFVARNPDGSSSNNLFNIKGQGDGSESVQVETTEYIADTPIKTSALFRKYPSVAHSFNDYVSLIKGNNRYEAALANAENPERYVDELHRAGYATDPHYKSKILAIYHGDELQQALQRNGFTTV